jgi:hypothetical protein
MSNVLQGYSCQTATLYMPLLMREDHKSRDQNIGERSNEI